LNATDDFLRGLLHAPKAASGKKSADRRPDGDNEKQLQQSENNQDIHDPIPRATIAIRGSHGSTMPLDKSNLNWLMKS
jgi:hypothetical protein